MALKRHPALQPFSRDHLIGLFHAQRLMKLEKIITPELLEDAITGFSAAWQREISVHFADEDRLIGPLNVSSRNLERLHNEHVELTALIEKLLAGSASALEAVAVGKILDAHIRWEEHELFPEIERTLDTQELEAMARETRIIEESRHRKL